MLIRQVPDVVHRKFKKACRARGISMEEAIVRLLAREVGEGRRGRPRTSGPKRRRAAAKRTSRASPRKAVRRPARTGRRRVSRTATRR